MEHDLHWWCKTLPISAAPIDRGCAVITTDTSGGSKSKVGDLRAAYMGMKANGQFNLTEQQKSTNTKELLLTQVLCTPF